MTIYRRRKLRIEEEPATTRELPPWNVPEKAKDGRTAEIKRALGQTGLDAVVKEALDSIEEPVKPKGPRATAAVTGAPKIAGIIERFKGLDRLPKGAAIDVGLDVGSRGIKCVVIAEVAGKNEIVFGSYAYHEGKTYRTAAELLEHVLDTSGVDAPNANAILRSITFTGSAGAGVHSALSAILNKSFDGLPGGRRSNFNVQYHREVPAQTLPFRPHFKPDRRPTVIIGIGGNDAKFISLRRKRRVQERPIEREMRGRDRDLPRGELPKARYRTVDEMADAALAYFEKHDGKPPKLAISGTLHRDRRQ